MTTRFVRDRPNLIWLEDRDASAKIEYGVARKLGCHTHMRGHPLEIMALLEDAEAESLDDLRIGFVIDVMIVGMVDLSGLGIEGSDTHGGMNGGYVFVDRILRDANSRCRFRPVCFLSERELTSDLEDDLSYLRDRKDPDGRSHGPVEYVRKYNSSELERFKKFLENL